MIEQPARRVGPPIIVGLVATLAVGLGVKVACTAGTLTLGEVGIPGCYSDVVGIFQARGLGADPLPYRDVLTEYPPVTALQWVLAQSVTASATGFLLATAAMSGLATGVSLWVLVRLGASTSRLWWFALAPTVLLGTFVNWDPVAVALMLAAILAHTRERPTTAGVLAGLGGLAKLFPVVVVPLMAWSLIGRGRRGDAGRLVAMAVGTVVGGLVLTWGFAGDGVWAMVEANASRPGDWDSGWYWVARATGLVLTPEAVNVASLVLTVAGWAIIGWRGRSLPVAERWVLTLPLLVWFLLAGKVYSPQFSLWILPLIVLLVADRRVVVAFLVTDALVFVTRFPFLSGEQGLDPSVPPWMFATALALRGLALVAILSVPIRLAVGPDARPSPEQLNPRPAVGPSG